MAEPGVPKPGIQPRRLLRWAFGASGVAFLAISFAATWERSQGWPVPSAPAIVGGFVLVAVGLLSLARSWSRLFPERERGHRLTAAFFASQLGRYIPGVIWQALAQVGLASEAGSSLTQASTAFGVFTVAEVAAGGTLGATLAIAPDGPSTTIRLAAALMVVPAVLLWRRWIAWGLHLLGRITRRTFADELIPSQGAIVGSYAWIVMTLVANGAAFAVLLAAVQGTDLQARSVAAFGFAWTVGFLAVPFPSGLGVREAVLILATGAPASAVIAASVLHRLISMGCEVLMIVGSRVAARAGVGPDADPGPDIGGAGV